VGVALAGMASAQMALAVLSGVGVVHLLLIAGVEAQVEEALGRLVCVNEFSKMTSLHLR
jgi:hypothetical protein